MLVLLGPCPPVLFSGRETQTPRGRESNREAREVVLFLFRCLLSSPELAVVWKEEGSLSFGWWQACCTPAAGP